MHDKTEPVAPALITGETTRIIGQNVRRIRDSFEPKLTQTMLAKAAGIARGTVADVERCRYDSVELSTVVLLAQALNVEPWELMIGPVGTGRFDVFVQELLDSPWKDHIKPTEDDIQWLRSIPSASWSGVRPTADALAELIMWRRRNQKLSS